MRTFALALLLLMAGGCSHSEKSSTAATNQAEVGQNPLDAPADYIGALGQAQKQAVSTADVATLTKAIQIFEAQEDRFPRDLKELVDKEYIPKLPLLPQGRTFIYDRTTGSVKVGSN